MLRFLLKVILIALALWACRGWLRPAYLNSVAYLSVLLSGTPAVTLYHYCLDIFIAYASLLVATPQMPWPRKAAMLAIGLALCVAIDVSSVFFVTPLDYQQTGVHNLPPSAGYELLYKTYARLLLPLTLWLVASYRYLGDLFQLDIVKAKA